jgi:hypothetical protein
MSIQRWLVLGLLGPLWGACRPEPAPAVGDDDDDTDSPATSSPTGETGEIPTEETGTSGTTGTPWDMEVDCTALLPVPVESVRHDWVSGSEDYTFSADGYLIQSAAGGLRRTPFGGPSELIVPGAPAARGTRYLPDGRIALNATETGSVVLVDPATGSQEVVASGLTNPNGMAVDPQGRIYVTVTAAVVRIDPASGAVDTIVDMPGNSFDGITFSHDYRRLYFNEELGQIHFVEIDEDGEAGEVRDGVRVNLSAFSILDGMAADACGNLYALEMDGTVWRVRMDGTVEVVAELAGTPISFPALNFGYPPVGGWDADALYVLTFTGSLHELQIGVPGKWEPHLPPAE